MCREVFENARVIGLETLEIQLALQCAPVIAGLKISNLLIIPSSQEEKLYHIFRNSEISFFRLLWADGKSTFLLYRKEMLEAYFMQWEVRTILKEAGYGNLQEKLKLFHKYETARSTQVQLLACGVFMEDIIDIYQQEWQQKAVI